MKCKAAAEAAVGVCGVWDDDGETSGMTRAKINKLRKNSVNIIRMILVSVMDIIFDSWLDI